MHCPAWLLPGTAPQVSGNGSEITQQALLMNPCSMPRPKHQQVCRVHSLVPPQFQAFTSQYPTAGQHACNIAHGTCCLAQDATSYCIQHPGSASGKHARSASNHAPGTILPCEESSRQWQAHHHTCLHCHYARQCHSVCCTASPRRACPASARQLRRGQHSRDSTKQAAGHTRAQRLLRLLLTRCGLPVATLGSRHVRLFADGTNYTCPAAHNTHRQIPHNQPRCAPPCPPAYCKHAVHADASPSAEWNMPDRMPLHRPVAQPDTAWCA
jgi:hypothetical protein